MGAAQIELRDLTFSYPTIDSKPPAGNRSIVKDLSFRFPPGSRVLLLGANGAGKTTLLRVLAGKHMVNEGAVHVLGEPPFHAMHLTTSHQLAYIGGEWERDVAFGGYQVPLMGDISAGQMLHNVPGAVAERRERLLEVLDINPSWRLHQISDGQRRRIQIAMGLLREFKVLLLDEITVDLDVLARASLMDFLKEETEQRGASIVYATHIFDGLDDWPTHVLFLSDGQAKICANVNELPSLQQAPRLLEWVESLLRAEMAAKTETVDLSPEQSSLPQWNNGYASGRLNSTLK